MGHIAILGGTGPEGLGLGLRLALCGEDVVLGSREAGRATEAARRATERLRAVACGKRVRGLANAAAIDGADLVVIAFPYAGVPELLPVLAPQLAGKVVLEAVNPIVRAKRIFGIESVPAGSAAEMIQELLPESQVVSGFKNESAEELKEIERPMQGHIVVCGNHAEARARVMELVRRIPKYRPVDAGALVNARYLEGMTALLLNINRRYRASTSIQIVGLPEDEA